MLGLIGLTHRGVGEEMVDAAMPGRGSQRPGGRTARVRARILEATVEVLAEHGIAGLRYEKIAEIASVTRTSVYRSWPDRARLISEALMQVATQAVPLADTGSLREDLVNYQLALATSLNTPTGRALTKVLEAAAQDPELLRSVNAAYEHRVAALQQRLSRAVEGGELPEVDGYLVGEMLTAPVHLYLRRAIRTFTRTEAEKITDIVLAGIQQCAT